MNWTPSASEDAAKILNILSEAYIRIDNEFRYRFVNRAAERLLGKSRAELLGNVVWEVSPVLASTPFEENLRRAMTGRAPITFESYTETWRRFFAITATPDSEGGIVVHFADITGHKRTEEALRLNEAVLAKSQEIAHVGSWDLDVVADRLSWSDEVYRIFGLRPREFAGSYEAFMEAVHPEDRAAVDAAYQGSLREGRDDYEIEHRVIRKHTGEIRHVHEKCLHLRDASGRIVRSVGIVQDITDRKRAEEARGRLSDIVERSLNEIYVFDAETLKFKHANLGALKNLQYTLDELGELTPVDLKPEYTEDAFRAMLRPLLANETETLVFETVHQRADGSMYPVEVHLRLVGVGAQRAFLAVIFDITERKRAEEEKARLQAQLIQAQKMESIGRLAGGVAHDFNNLLTVINGYSQLLIRKLNPGDPMRSTIEEIHKAGERAAGLTRHLLAFSRKQVLQPRLLDLNRVVNDLRPTLTRLAREDVELRVALDAEIGMVHADPRQLEQVLMNLVINARDAMPHGGKLLIETANVEWDQSGAQAHPDLRSGRYVRLSVSDNGAGMDEETRRKIFEPFFTTKEVGQGTGLGLCMVQGVVAQSGGGIEVESEPGRGTTFKIYLPRLEKAADAGMPEAVPALGGTETVMVVEDYADVREYAATVLEAYGYRVIKAENAGEALAHFEREGEPERIDLLLTDVAMPEVSGRELATRIERLGPGIKVLFMSGHADDVIAHHGVVDAGTKLIQKPFSPDKLAAAVRAALGHA